MGNQIIIPNEPSAYRGLWEDLFFDFDHEKTVSIKVIGQPNSESRSLWIQYVSSSSTQELPFDEKSSVSSSNRSQQTAGLPQIEFRWKRAGQPEIITRPIVNMRGLQLDVPRVDVFPCVWFTSGVAETPDENAKRFSELDKRGEIEPVVSALAKEFSYIRGLSIDYHAGIPMVFAELADRKRKMPVPLVSDGVNRLMGICLGIATYRNGVVLVDQLEDGFHHSLLASIWNTLHRLAVHFNVQMFISSHSAECIHAMQGVLTAHAEDFRLLRCSRLESGCGIDVLTGKYLESAVEQSFEVR
jgi:hypothetical protein